MRTIATLALLLAVPGAAAADEVTLYAAGALRAPMVEIAAAFKASAGHSVDATYGSSGQFREQIIAGDRVHVFASASLEHARAVARAGKSGPAVVFARNRLCALARADLGLTSTSLLDSIRKPSVRLATLTPLADPAGDLAVAMFARADVVKPGVRDELQDKAIRPTGGASEDQPPSGRNVYAWFFEQGRVDVFLTYCSNIGAAQAELADLRAIELPPELSVAADFALTVAKDAPASAYQLALFLLSGEGQSILARHGFTGPTAAIDARR